MEQIYCLYKTSSLNGSINLKLPAGFYETFWIPTFSDIFKNELGKKFYRWYFPFFFSVIKSKPLFGAKCIWKENQLVHHSFFSRSCFKWPFMNPKDIQIGPVSTDEPFRRRGLAKYSLFSIIKEFPKSGRNYWWIVRKENIFSIKLVEEMGFTFESLLEKRPFLGCNIYSKVGK
ncbi:MAG: GNAT family N-acetyltransferase [Candidatus Riflebacteria bacterium]|nr:GNAT family N-acetyltransferase [Candidatus Riflebacteria bacterium]